MSYTEVYTFNEKGEGEFAFEIRNAHRGAMAVWHNLNNKYFPGNNIHHLGESGHEGMSKVWNLFSLESVPDVERICLGTTFDNFVVRRSNLQKVIDAFKEFGGETSLPEQAEELQKILDSDNKFLAVGWNQTSVSGDNWSNYGNEDLSIEEYEDLEESVPYNINTGDRHIYLFGQLDDEEG